MKYKTLKNILLVFIFIAILFFGFCIYIPGYSNEKSEIIQLTYDMAVTILELLFTIIALLISLLDKSKIRLLTRNNYLNSFYRCSIATIILSTLAIVLRFIMECYYIVIVERFYIVCFIVMFLMFSVVTFYLINLFIILINDSKNEPDSNGRLADKILHHKK